MLLNLAYYIPVLTSTTDESHPYTHNSNPMIDGNIVKKLVYRS